MDKNGGLFRGNVAADCRCPVLAGREVVFYVSTKSFFGEGVTNEYRGLVAG